MSAGAVIDPDGTVVFRDIRDVHDLWVTCGGWTVAADMPHGWQAVMHSNDEADRLGLPMNPLASSLSGVWPGSVVRGTAVILGPGETDLPAQVARQVHDLAVSFHIVREALGASVRPGKAPKSAWDEFLDGWGVS